MREIAELTKEKIEVLVDQPTDSFESLLRFSRKEDFSEISENALENINSAWIAASFDKSALAKSIADGAAKACRKFKKDIELLVDLDDQEFFPMTNRRFVIYFSDKYFAFF